LINTNLFWYGITLTSGIIEWFVLKFIYDQASDSKRTKLITNLSFVVPIVILFSMSVLGVNMFLKLICGVIMAFIIYRLNYKTTLIKCIFISLLYFMLLVGVDTLSSSLLISVNKLSNFNMILNNNVFRLENTIVSKAMLLLIVPTVKGIKLSVEISKREYVYMLVPIATNIIIIIVVIALLFSIPNISTTQSTIAFCASSLLLLSNLILIYITSRTIKMNELKFENKIIKEKMEYQCKHYLSLEKARLGIDTLYNTNNNILDIILTEKKSNCDNCNIKLTVNIDFLEGDFIEISDLCSIFSNIIDNAIEVCNKVKSKIGRKEIILSGKVVNNFFVIKCRNTTEKLKLVKDSNINIKEENYNREITTIINSLEKYKGEIVIEEDNKFFIVTILIPLIYNCSQSNK
jgi:hypothetical protein